MVTSPRLFTRSFVLAVLSAHCFFISYNMAIAEVPRSLAGEPPWVVGIVVGAMGIAGTLARPLVGVWLEAGNRVKFVRLGAIGVVLAFGGYALDLGPWPMLVFRLVHGFCTGMYTTSLLSVVGGAVPADRRGTGIGLYQTSGAVAQLYSAPLAIWLIMVTDVRTAFIVSAVACVGALVCGGLVRDLHAPSVVRHVGPWWARTWVSRTALLPALVFLSVTAPYGAVQAFLLQFADERGLANPGLFYTVVAVSQVVARGSAGALVDRIRPVFTIVPALIFGAIGLLLLSMSHSQGMLMVSGLLYGLGLASTQTSIVALVVGRVTPRGLGAAMATYTMAWDAGLVLGGVMFGFVVDATSPATAFAIMSAMPLAGAALFVLRVAREPSAPVASPPAAAAV